MKIVGIDPGYERLGIALLEKNIGKEELVDSLCIRTDPKISHQKRLFKIGKEVESLLERWKPDHIAIEDLFFSTNQKTALDVTEVVGMIRYIAECFGVTVYEYTPAQIKIAVTGYGRGTKIQVTEMVKRLIRVPTKKMLDDEYDAIAVGLTHLASFRNLRA